MRSSISGPGQKSVPADSSCIGGAASALGGRRVVHEVQLAHEAIRLRPSCLLASPSASLTPRARSVLDAIGQQALCTPLGADGLHGTYPTLLLGSSSSWSRSARSRSVRPGGGAPHARLPNQAESVFNPTGNAEDYIRRVPVAEASKSISDLDYLTELMAIQQSDGPKNMGFFGTRNMGVTHQKLVEVLSYAYASMGNHLYTSGAIGTNAAVIKGALRANAPDKLTVILPQSLKRQPAESQELLLQVEDLVEMPENDEMSLLESSRICNRKIISHVQQVICFAFHDSRLLMETCHEAKDSKKIVTLFFLD